MEQKKSIRRFMKKKDLWPMVLVSGMFYLMGPLSITIQIASGSSRLDPLWAVTENMGFVMLVVMFYMCLIVGRGLVAYANRSVK